MCTLAVVATPSIFLVFREREHFKEKELYQALLATTSVPPALLLLGFHLLLTKSVEKCGSVQTAQ